MLSKNDGNGPETSVVAENVEENSTRTRNHWFVKGFIKNILVKTPIIGSFFSDKSWRQAAWEAGECVAVLTGEAIMMMNVLVPTETDTTEKKTAKIMTSMALGTMAGKVAYNGLYVGGQCLYQYCQTKNNQKQPIPFTPVSTVEATDIHSSTTPHA